MIRKHIFYGALTFALGCIAGSAITYGIISKDVKTETTTPQPTPPPSPVKALSEYQGIDVSNHQGRIDWSLVSKDIMFAAEKQSPPVAIFYSNLRNLVFSSVSD